MGHSNIGKYTTETNVDDLLKDDFFLESILRPSEETVLFWNTIIKEGILDPQVYADAKIKVLDADLLSQISDSQVEVLWGRIRKKNLKILRKKRVLKVVMSVATVAAAFLLLFAITHQFALTSPELSSRRKKTVEIADFRSDKIQLVTSSDQPIEISGQEATIDYSSSEAVTVNGETITNKEDVKAGKIIYNEIIVPYGKRTNMILSDNTKLWINAGSKVKYPVEFADDKREIFVEGEVYADVAKDPDRQFVFRTSKLNVAVLGTSLNVKAYRGQSEQQVVLVTGSVKVMSETYNEKILAPNHMYSYSDGLSRVQKVNPKNYTSWISGYYTFENEKLDVILKSISQYYGVKINCLAPKVLSSYSGDLELKDDVSDVLSGLCYMLSMEYKYENESYILIRK